MGWPSWRGVQGGERARGAAHLGCARAAAVLQRLALLLQRAQRLVHVARVALGVQPQLRLPRLERLERLRARLRALSFLLLALAAPRARELLLLLLQRPLHALQRKEKGGAEDMQ